MSTTPDHLPTADAPARPPQGTPEELESTQRWWLTWVYGPVMLVLTLGALVAAAGDADPLASGAVVGIAVGSIGGAVARFRAQWRTTGRLAADERDETSSMRTMGYAFCFVYFAVLGWAVAWAAFDGSGTPDPFIALAGLLVCLGLGRLCTRREGF